MDYQTELEKTLNRIAKKGIAFLATSYKDKPSIRPVSVVLYDGKIAFQTSTKLLKYRQLEANPHVAFSVDNISVDCVATIKGHPTNELDFLTRYQDKHKGSFENYTHMQSNRVIELTPVRIQRWDYIDGEPYIVTLDLTNETLQNEHYSHLQKD